MKKHKICIVGGGLTGLISALVLTKKELDIDLIVENTSYFVTKKSEFSKILRKNRGSLEALIIEIQKI